MIWAPLLIQGVKAFFKNRQARKKEKVDIEHKQYLAEVQAGLHDPNKLRFLKWASFTGFTAPMVCMFFWPDEVTVFMVNLDSMPEWYIKGYLLITGSIWGGTVAKDVMEGVIRSVRKR